MRASWELPSYQRDADRAARATRPILVGLLLGVTCLGAGYAAGYWAGDEAAQPQTIVVTRQAAPTDANGMTLGKRLPPEAPALPVVAAPAVVPQAVAPLVDANGMTLGKRLPTESATVPVVTPLVDANGMTLGKRLPTEPATVPVVTPLVDANGMTLGKRLPTEG